MTETAASTKRRKIAQKFALFVSVFFLCFGILEVVLRLSGYGNLEVYDPDPILYWRLKPNQDCYTKVNHKPVHINSHGTRGAEFSIEKPANTIRILSLGDSRTFGWGLAENETYSAVLKGLLQKQYLAGTKVEVINAGVNAWSYPQMGLYFRNTGLSYKPDIVILAEANQWTQFSEKNPPEFVRQFMRRVRLKNLLRRCAIYHYAIELKLKAFYERHRTKFIPVDAAQDELFKAQQQSNPEGVFRDAIDELCRLAKEHTIRPVLLYLPAVDEASAPNTPLILKVKREISEKRHVPLLDFSAEVQKAGNSLYLEGDPVHFNASGNALIATRLFELVKPFVPQ